MGETIATRQAYGEALIELGEKNPEIVVLDADLSKSTMTVHFSKRFPERFFNMGIAEQNMYGVAAGLALSGKTVFASTFAMFAAGRAFEIIRNAIAHTGANVKICATHAGITVGEDGASHQAVEDLALMRAVPGITVVHPSDAVSTRKLICQAAETEGPFYFRLGRLAAPVLYGEDQEIRVGKGVLLREGGDVAIIACGLMVKEALAAAETLETEGIRARVIDMHTIKPIDRELIIKAASETRGIVTAEEHSVLGGLGSAVCEVLAETIPARVRMVGLRDTFGESGKPAELMEKYGLTAEAIAKAAREAAAEQPHREKE